MGQEMAGVERGGITSLQERGQYGLIVRVPKLNQSYRPFELDGTLHSRILLLLLSFAVLLRSSMSSGSISNRFAWNSRPKRSCYTSVSEQTRKFTAGWKMSTLEVL